ncbi:hypothetical protein PEC18_36125 [Paucibacter sp. O1-1]|nr:hypothetical protein [Paucibacter sp. O1-1]MDA3831083.1 hypothetical protein [Paucibacter sp. O1-1]
MDESPKTPQPIKQPDVIEASTSDQHSNNALANQLKEWQALSPWSIITYVFGALKGILSNGIAIIPIVYTGWKQGFDGQWLVLMISVIVLLVSVAAVIEWHKFRFRLSGGNSMLNEDYFLPKR